MDSDVEEVTKTCHSCQSQKCRPSKVNPCHPWIYPAGPWRRVHADFAELSGKHYLLMVDAFTKWPEVLELGAHATTGQAIDAMRRTFSYHGLPHKLVTDNGPQFTSHDFQDFMKANGIKHQCTPPYHPASNGQAERFVRELKKSLMGRPQGRSVSHQVSVFLLHYRTTPSTTTGKTPAELMYKRRLRTRLTLVRPEDDTIRERQRLQYEEATDKVRQFEPGDTVSVWNPRQDSRGKWLVGTITQRLGPTNYLVNIDGNARCVHIDQIRDGRGVMPSLSTEVDLPMGLPLTTQGPQLRRSEESIDDIGEPNAQTEEQQATTEPQGQTEISTSDVEVRRYPKRQNIRPPLRYRDE